MIKSLYNKLPRRLCAFLCVGAMGFVLDASILSTLIFDFGWGHYISRVVSFGVAVPFSWLLNRIWTFRSNATTNRTREYSIYLAIQATGAGLNFAIYSTCIYLSDTFMDYPVAALAIGSGFALLFNYTAVRRYAFTGATQTDIQTENSLP